MPRAAFGALFYCLVLVGGLFLLKLWNLISPFSAFVATGLAALVTSAVLFLQLRRMLPPTRSSPDAAATWRKHWGYGRWALAAAIAGWVPAYVYYPLLGSFHGMAQTGELRALMNFVQPLSQFYAALSLVFLPYASRQHVRDPRRGTGLVARNITLLFMGTTLAYWIVILLMRTNVLHWLYGNKYNDLGYLIPAITVGSVLWSGTIGASIVLRAMESPDTIVFAYCAASAVSVAVGIPLTRIYGLSGAVWAMNLSDAVALAMVVFLLKQRLSRPK